MGKSYKCLTKIGIKDYTEDELYEEATQIIWAILKHKYNRYSVHHADIAQEVALAICRAMERYDPNKGMVFAYIKTIATRRTCSAIRRINAINRREIALTAEMESAIPLSTPDYQTRAELKIWIDNLKTMLTDIECKVIDLNLEGYSNVEIYNALYPNTSKTHIGQSITKIWESIAAKAKKMEDPKN